MNKQLIELKMQFVDALKDVYSEDESILFFGIILRDRFDISKTDQVLGMKTPSAEEITFLDEASKRLLESEPIQQVIGFNYFYDLKFKVTQDTLIPRPETEELVDWILTDRINGKGLDIGTGSGCISICLAANGNSMSAIDVSSAALRIAKENASLNQTEVAFSELNILENSLKDNFSELDFVVSNPPYVLNSDKSEMKSNVLEFEPHLALFVEDDDALLFYREIGIKSREVLKSGGKLYFEIHEDKSTEVTKLLSELGYTNIEERKDLQGKPRMIKAIWS
jgi:release factor glutamine methyltransferase